MAEITAALVKKLRDATGAGMMDCKKALKETGGDLEQAIDWLRKKSLAKASDMADRSANEGRVFSYIHHNQRVGAMLEASCETDFVAANDDFVRLFHDICLHIVGKKPQYLRREDVPPEIIEHERAIVEEQVQDQIKGKPAEVVSKIVDGKMSAFLKEIVLLEQPHVKDDKRTVEEVVKEFAGKVGENIQIRRFNRYEVGL